MTRNNLLRGTQGAPGNEFSQKAVALGIRSRLNTARGSFNLGDDLARLLLDLPPGDVLDLGAGTGSVLFGYLPRLPSGRICVAMDVSGESLSSLETEASRRNLPVSVREADMDSLVEHESHPDLRELAAVCAIYSLYYSQNPAGLLMALAGRLSRSGRLIVAAPAAGNNDGWFDFLEDAGVLVPRGIRNLGQTFLRDVVEPAARQVFQSSARLTRTNRVACDSADLLKNYWRANIYFDPQRDDAVCAAIERHYQTKTHFVIEKKVGILFAEGLAG
jgi:SAM-dependent methyltransferase